MTVDEIRYHVHQKVLTLRALDRIVQSPQFQYLYSKCKDQNKVTELILNYKYEELVFWIDTSWEKELGEYSVRSLRDLARNLGVSNITSLTKAELIARIQERQKCVNASKN